MAAKKAGSGAGNAALFVLGGFDFFIQEKYHVIFSEPKKGKIYRLRCGGRPGFMAG